MKLEENCYRSVHLLKEVYGSECLERTQVFEWFIRFKEGSETTEDDSQHENGPHPDNW